MIFWNYPVLVFKLIKLGLTPYIFNPSSVSVPVLSKHITYSLPLILTLYADIQNIFCFFNLVIALSNTPYIHNGRDGGIAIVNNSNALNTNL